MEKKNIKARVELDLARRFKVALAEAGDSGQEVIARAIKTYTENREWICRNSGSPLPTDPQGAVQA